MPASREGEEEGLTLQLLQMESALLSSTLGLCSCTRGILWWIRSDRETCMFYKLVSDILSSWLKVVCQVSVVFPTPGLIVSMARCWTTQWEEVTGCLCRAQAQGGPWGGLHCATHAGLQLKLDCSFGGLARGGGISSLSWLGH